MNTTMKKLTAILAASCLLASLAACKGPETELGQPTVPFKIQRGNPGNRRLSPNLAIRRRRFGIQQSFCFQ